MTPDPRWQPRSQAAEHYRAELGRPSLQGSRRRFAREWKRQRNWQRAGQRSRPGHEYNTGGGYPNAGTGGYGSPACLYCPQPQFSDEAVKAKYQGTVLLVAIITADGRATDIRVAKGLGLGLDEKAVEAVRTWRFRPALGPDGKPASVRQTHRSYLPPLLISCAS